MGPMERTEIAIFEVIGYVLGRLCVWLFWMTVWTIHKLFHVLTDRPVDHAPSVGTRLTHTHIVASSGFGKTQLLQNYISHDLRQIAAGKRSIIVIDSQGDLIGKILRIKQLSPDSFGLSDRLVLIDPHDTDRPPCLNLFDFGLTRIDTYDPVEREKLVNGAIFLYEYVFGALLGADMTTRQSVTFRYLAKLLMVVPGATIHTLMNFLEHPESINPYLSRCDDATQRFLTKQFNTHAYDANRGQILARLYAVISIDTIARMFSHAHNKVNLLDAMNRGSLILINTSKELLKQEGC